jgi:hypothetical protein
LYFKRHTRKDRDSEYTGIVETDPRDFLLSLHNS